MKYLTKYLARNNYKRTADNEYVLQNIHEENAKETPVRTQNKPPIRVVKKLDRTKELVIKH